jgi:hypothetical protein
MWKLIWTYIGGFFPGFAFIRAFKYLSFLSMKLRVLLIAFLLLAPLAPSISATPPKAGEICSKAGLTKNYNGKKFTCIKSGKKLVWDKGVPIMKSAPSQIPTPQASPSSKSANSPSASSRPTASPSSEQTYIQSAKIAEVKDCKIEDGRKDTSLRFEDYQRNAGFPLQGAILPTKGKINFVTFLIDFSDAQGTEEELQFFRSQEEKFVNWFEIASYGKLKARITTINRWFRATKPSSEFVLSQSNYGMHPKMAQELVDLTGNTFNWQNVDAFIVHFPRLNKSKLFDAQLGRNVLLNFPDGAKKINYQFYGVGTNRMAETQKAKYPDFWSQLWIHENLHDLGLTLHAPGNGFNTGIGQNEASYSLTLSAWDMFKLEWIEDEQVFCAPLNAYSQFTTELVPLEVEGVGYRILVIPVSKFQALVVESRRPVGLSIRWPNSMSGLFVYRVDAAVITDRSSEFNGSGSDNGNNPKFPKWAFYLAPDQRFIDSSLTMSKLNPDKYYQDWLIRVGESVTSDGVKISFVKTGKTDVVQVTKV